MQGEATLLRLAAGRDVPVPTVVADDDGSELGGPSIVMDRLEGETIARKLLRDDEWAVARTKVVDQAGAALASIHGIPLDEVGGLKASDQLDEMRALAHALPVSLPAMELGLRWLEEHRPASPRRTVVHGDFRLGNLMIDQDGLAGVLDWELSHVGDPLEDLGWFCVRAWRFGSPLPAGGMGTREQLVAAYEQAGGPAVPSDELRWWELLGTLKWGLICVMQAQIHLSGVSRSMELATIGRRVCENEWDVLGLLPGPELKAEVATVASPPSDLYGRPSAGELLEAIREWVEGDVRGSTDGRVAFHTRVAANALATLEREVALGPVHRERHATGLGALACGSEADLVAKIRDGSFDDRLEEVRVVVADSVRCKLEVANPRWLLPD